MGLIPLFGHLSEKSTQNGSIGTKLTVFGAWNGPECITGCMGAAFQFFSYFI